MAHKNQKSLSSQLLIPTMIFSALLQMGCDSGQDGSEERGKNVFRTETFGNEGFWTDAAKLPQGIVDNQVTPVDALKLGLSVNTEALDQATAKAVVDEIAKSGTNGPILNSFDTTVKLLNANAVIGVVVRDTNKDGKLDITNGDKVGIACVLCHGVTDKSVFSLSNGGSIGKELDGPASHTLHTGEIFALANNTRAFYPMGQLLQADGKSIGRAPSNQGLTKLSTEAEVDAYFSNNDYYPVGMFDDTVDGNGNPMHNMPLFRQDLAAPYGSAGELTTHDQFANTVYTVLLDPTDLLTPGGKKFLHLAAGAGGDQLAADYADVLADTGVTGYPYAKTKVEGKPGDGDSLIGLKVDHQKLLDMNAYVFSLHSPLGERTNIVAISRGKKVFNESSAGCTSCHNTYQDVAVSDRVFDMETIFRGDNPRVLATRMKPFSPVEDTPGNTFDDKDIVINASLRGLNRGVALPLLMDLARKPVFLHDNSVATLENLFDPSRGNNAPHAFYIDNSGDRLDLVEYLNSLDDSGFERESDRDNNF